MKRLRVCNLGVGTNSDWLKTCGGDALERCRRLNLLITRAVGRCVRTANPHQRRLIPPLKLGTHLDPQRVDGSHAEAICVAEKWSLGSHLKECLRGRASVDATDTVLIDD